MLQLSEENVRFINEFDTIRVWIKDEKKGYNPMYKFDSIEELIKRVKNNDNVPPVDSFVTEARRDDNIIALNKSWHEVLDMIILLFGYEDRELDRTC